MAAFSASSNAKIFSDSMSLGPTATDVKYRISGQIQVNGHAVARPAYRILWYYCLNVMIDAKGAKRMF